MKFTRREVIVTGAAAGLAACAPAGPTGPRTIVPAEYDHAQSAAFAPEALAEDTTLFPLGIQAGAMRADGAVLWTQLVGSPSAQLRVWRDPDGAGNVQLAFDAPVSGDAAGFVHARVEGLAPATWYSYGFFDAALGQRSLLGRFRTAYPDDWSEPVLLGVTSCTNFKKQPYTALQTMARQGVDVFMHLGDISYNDSANTLDEFRGLWKRTLQDPGYRDVLPSAGWYTTYDDHELANNLDPETADPARIATARASYFETIAAEAGEQGQSWRSYRWGGTAEIFILDCRSERKPSTIGTPDATYLSRAQMDWLKGALQASTAHFKVIMNSVPITLFPPPLWAVQNDRWEGYTAQREEFLSFLIDENIEHVVFITGDFHLGLVMRVEKEGPRRRFWEIAAGPGGNSGNPLSLVWDSPENRPVAFPKQQFLFCGGVPMATTVELNPKDNTIRVKFIDPEGDEVKFDQTLGADDA